MYRTNIVRVISTANYGTKGKSTAQREEEKKAERSKDNARSMKHSKKEKWKC